MPIKIIKKKAAPTPPPPVKVEPYVPHVAKYAGKEPKECSFCEKVYMAPCDGEKADCPNRVFIESKSKS